MMRHNGFTLIELLVSLAILVSLTAIAVPGLAEFTVKTRVDNEVSRLHRLLQLARNSAINSGSNTTICPLVNNICTDNWALQIFVFNDGNNNKKLEKNFNEKILSVKGAIRVKDKLHYGKNRTAITYTASGSLSSWGQNGTFKYCPFSHASMARGLIISTSGRVYKSYQSTTGKEVNRSTKVIRCT